jgi:hypothetical protein
VSVGGGVGPPFTAYLKTWLAGSLVTESIQVAVINPLVCAEKICVALLLVDGEKPTADQLAKVLEPPLGLQLHETAPPKVMVAPVPGLQVTTGCDVWAPAARAPTVKTNIATASAATLLGRSQPNLERTWSMACLTIRRCTTWLLYR